MKRTLTPADASRLLAWLKGNALDMARELRDAGWEEDKRGLWRDTWGKARGMGLLDAHEAMRRAGKATPPSNSCQPRAIT